MRLLELAFKWGGQAYGAALTGPHHCVVVPPELPLRALRDALCAALFGAEHFAGGARGGLRNAGLVFEVNGIRYKVLVDLTTGRRVLVHLQGGRPETISDQAGPISQSLNALLNLPSPMVYRSLALSEQDFPAAPPPRLPPGLHRAILAHAEHPERLPAELEAAVRQAETARVRARVPVARVPWREPLALAAAGAGVLTLACAALARSDLRMVGLATPVVLGAAAWRALRWIDATEDRTAGLKAVDEAEATVRARRRQLEELESQLTALAATVGSRDPLRIAEALQASAPQPPGPEVQDHVEVYAGDRPAAEVVSAVVEAFGQTGATVAAAGLVLAAVRGRGARGAPLIWAAEGDAGIPWSRVFEAAGPDVSLLIFRHAARPEDRPVALAPARPVEASA